jgi:very-short-patch-repair endonuclease
MRLRVHNTLATKDLRRRLRRENTPYEKILWSALRNRKLNGEKFTRQHGIGPYVADFYCSKYKLAVEVDGEIHLRPDIVERDKVRTEFIEAWEITIVRFTNDEVLNNLSGVLEELKNYLK